MTEIYGLGLGVGSQNRNGDWLEVYYPQPLLQPAKAVVEAFVEVLEPGEGDRVLPVTAEQAGRLAAALHRQQQPELATLAEGLQKSSRPLVVTILTGDSAPTSVPAAFLKLHFLSHRLVKPHQTDLSGLFGVLKNLAWTNEGAVDLEELPERQLQARLEGRLLTVDCVDKFPRMTNYVVPKGVRIADTARVRLGAYIGEGTTIMHEGFVNFNAGTLGTSMVEGRISAGVLVGEGSDLGGGSSTMGTLSGGGNIVISLGRECLLGANSGIGIPLGDRCTVEAGLYITAGTKVALLDENNELVEHVKARDLAGRSELLFRRNSLTGVVECKTNRSAVALNEELHANN